MTENVYGKDPFHRTISQQVAIANVPRVTGGLSFFCSLILIISMLQSDVKLGTPFRRIMFAMCVIDLLQSSTAAISTLSSPKGVPGIWGAHGTDATCSLTGFIFNFSSIAAALYMVSLLSHYFFFVQNKVSLATFRKWIEPLLHIIPIGFSLSTSIFLLSEQYFNQADAVCWIAPVPYNCINEDDVECIRGENSYSYRWIFSAGPNGLALILLNFLGLKMYMIIKRRENQDATAAQSSDENNATQEEISEEDSGSSPLNNGSNRVRFNIDEVRSSNIHQSSIPERQAVSNPPLSNIVSPSSHGNIEERKRILNERKAKKALGFKSSEALKQAFFFTLAFYTCYIWVYLNGAFEAIPGRESPYIVRLGLWFFFPLQGFFNIITFIRPHVKVLVQNEGMPLMEAVILVVKSGGDISIESARLKKNKRAGIKRKTKIEQVKDNRPVHLPPQSTTTSARSRPMTHIDRKSGIPEEVSSMGLESFKDDILHEEEHSQDNNQGDTDIEYDADDVLYGEQDDCDIYSYNDDHLSYETDLFNADGISLMSYDEENVEHSKNNNILRF